jgi:nucleoside-diphosphate-sugar epimerase
VIGLDTFHAYYARERKERNLAGLLSGPNFQLVEADLRTADLAPILDGVEAIYHEAAMPGLLRSWDWFEEYMTCNVLATQRLLEAARSVSPRVFVQASTSSVYGRSSSCAEDSRPQPISPYGATKLCAENLGVAYRESFGVPFVVVRYFSVYGPRQRPDMGYTIFVDKVLRGEPITIFGDGEQTRGNTYVTDIVDATVRAGAQGEPGEVYNIGGGESRSANWIVETIQRLAGQGVEIVHGPARPGEQRDALADTSKARGELGWAPKMSLEDGLREQIAYQRGELS